MNQKLYPAFKSQLLSGLTFLFFFAIFFIPVFMQVGKPFNLQLFFIELFLMSVCSVFFFFFLRNLFCPVVQIYNSEVIVSKFIRVRVPKNMIKEFALDKGKVKLLYVEGTDLKEIVVAVRKMNEEESEST